MRLASKYAVAHFTLLHTKCKTAKKQHMQNAAHICASAKGHIDLTFVFIDLSFIV